MRPRDENSALFRENVYKSWKIMAQLARRIDGQCYVAHSDTPEGVGYDNLVLVTTTSDGSMIPQVVMNRNGANSTKVRLIWEKCEEIGIEGVVETLLATCEATSMPFETQLSRLCDEVVSWIERHRNEEFYVGPVHWWGSCRQLLDIPVEEFPNGEWPLERHGPEISLGINMVEVKRLTQRRSVRDSAEHSPRERDKSMKSTEDSSEYETLERALAAWVPLQDRSYVWEEIANVIKKISDLLGDVIRVHIPPRQNYVAVTFAREPKRVGAYIAVGHVNHIIEVPGSSPSRVDPGYWRSNLSTAGVSPERAGGTQSSTVVMCPTCYEQISRYAECRCGWRPTDL